MMDVTKATYQQLEQRVGENRCIIRTAKDDKLKRRLILENHEMMVEMDRRWITGQETTRRIK